MKCGFITICPSFSGWCLNRYPSSECIPFVQHAVSNLEIKLKDAKDVEAQLELIAMVEEAEE